MTLCNDTKSHYAEGMLRVCHLTTVHPRNDIRIFLKESRALALVGFDVHLVVGDGEGDADIDGVQVHDIGVKPLSRIKRILLQPKRALKKILSLNPSIVHFHDPELLPVGVKLAKYGIHVIYDAHEDVPRQILMKCWIPRAIRFCVARVFEFYENRAVTKLSGVVAATSHIERRFSELGLRTVNVNNYPMSEELAPVDGALPPRLKRVCYIGGISKMRGAVQLVHALSLLPDVRLTLCGHFDGPDFAEELKKVPGWAQVDYFGHVDRETVRRVVAESIAGIVTFLPGPNHIDSQPNKLFEYMSAELPVIASDFPLWRKIVDGAGCGLCVNPESPTQIASAIRVLLDSPQKVKEMGRAGRLVVLEKYNWPVEAKKMVDFYKALA
ncbi:MAG: glycosyltransferase [Proteobacteria bacterium]|nr:glycosyltransferase [Pseudomonadota bacterium]